MDLFSAIRHLCLLYGSVLDRPQIVYGVFDTPLAESGIAGLSFGLALEGFRPVPEIQFFGFIFEAMDEVVAQMVFSEFFLQSFSCPENSSVFPNIFTKNNDILVIF